MLGPSTPLVMMAQPAYPSRPGPAIPLLPVGPPGPPVALGQQAPLGMMYRSLRPALTRLPVPVPTLSLAASVTEAGATDAAAIAAVPRKRAKRLYSCEQCSYVSACSSNLVRHRRIHTGQKPYQCAHCAAFFTNSSNRRKHERRCILQAKSPSSTSGEDLPCDA